MKKKFLVLFIAAVSAVVLCGCKSVKSTTETITYGDLEQTVSFVEAFSKVASEQTVNRNVSVTAEATGGEEESERNVIKNIDVYSKPDLEASRIGAVESGNTISVIGLLESEDWYKVCYNGRVGYVQAAGIEALEEEDEDTLVSENIENPEDESDNSSEENTPTNHAGVGTNASTPSASTSTPSGTTTSASGGNNSNSNNHTTNNSSTGGTTGSNTNGGSTGSTGTPANNTASTGTPPASGTGSTGTAAKPGTSEGSGEQATGSGDTSGTTEPGESQEGANPSTGEQDSSGSAEGNEGDLDEDMLFHTQNIRE